VSKRREILAAIDTALSGIATASGDNYDVDSVRYGVRDPGRINAFPAIDFFAEDEDGFEYQPDGTAEATLEVTVAGYLRGVASDDAYIAEDLAEDIVRVIHANHTLGLTGVADVSLVRRSVDPNLDASEMPRVVLLTFEIVYFDNYETV